MTEDWKAEQKIRGQAANKQQRQASAPHRSVWVEASAGTGKTKVLSDRVLRLLLKGVQPAKILCLTYTKAAAVEMSDRIAKRLSEWAVISDEELDKGIKEAAEQYGMSVEDFLKEIGTKELFKYDLLMRKAMKIVTAEEKKETTKKTTKKSEK